jgi:YbbR domain-containing protein
VNILDISPKEILVELDHKALKEVPIKLQYIGMLPNKRQLKEIAIYPDKVMVSGPMELLRDISSFNTAPINLNLLNKDDGSLRTQLADVDSRLKLEESSVFKVKFKTQQIIENNIKIIK